ncbi:MAG: RsiV family protein [Bacillota bacterium]
MRWMYGVVLALCCMLLCACSASPIRSEVLDIEAVDVADEDRGTPVPTLRMNSGGVKPAAAAHEPAASPVALETCPPAEPAPEKPGKTPSPAPAKTSETAAAEVAQEPAPDEEMPEEEQLFSGQAATLASTTPMLDATAMEYVFQALALAGVNAEREDFHVRVTCSTASLFSCVAEVEKRSGRKGYTMYPVTVDMHNGKVLLLSDFFSSTDREWRSVLPDIVTEIANDRGMTLLCEVPPVSDDQPFYIDKGDIVLLYRPYEITTYDAGEPCFELPMRDIAPYTTGAYGIGG